VAGAPVNRIGGNIAEAYRESNVCGCHRHLDNSLALLEHSIQHGSSD
jgi:hypothetical protein